MVQNLKNRTDQEWLDLIRDCRSSDLTVKAWCEAHHMSCSYFYRQIKILRNKDYEIPDSSLSKKKSSRQEIVPVEIMAEDPATDIIPEPKTATVMPAPQAALRLQIGDIQIEILNGADTEVIRNTLLAMGVSC